MVKAEQLAQRVGVFRGPLQRVEQAKLTVQQRLVTQRQVQEDLADSLAQVGLADGRVDSGALHGGEGLGDPGDLGDLAYGQRRGLRRPRPPRRRPPAP